MPSVINDAAGKAAGKRKRQEHGVESKKKRKSGSGHGDDNGDEEHGSRAIIEKLEMEIQESKRHYNNIATLIELTQKHEDEPKYALAASEALCRTFIRLLAAGNLVKKKDVSEKKATIVSWLRTRLADYRGFLLSMFRSKQLAPNALMLAMALLKAEAQYLTDREEAVFPRIFFSDIVATLLESPVEPLLGQFSDKFVGEYHDIRFYTFEAIK